MLKAVVAIEVVFLVTMWSFYADRIRSSRIWSRGTTRPSTRGAIYNRGDHSYQGNAKYPGVWRQHTKDESRQEHYREQKERRALAKALAKDGPIIDAIPDARKGPTLVIGGSDGSGTRAFANIMKELNVPMRVQDEESLDIHGAELFQGQGWPPMARMILNATRSANYELHDLSNTMVITLKRELHLLKDALDAWQLKLERKHFVKQRLNLTIPRANKVSIGFKAPVTMLLLPLLKETFGRIKFLHIVRDGRDVSMSTNKSPVEKFYKSMYVDAVERLNKYADGSYPILAMDLWNDWNTQAMEWEHTHANDPDFDYLVVRSEDLVDPSQKFETLARLAAFVGSPKTLQELCCMSRQEEEDMGRSFVSSDKTAADYVAHSHGRDLYNNALRNGGVPAISEHGRVEVAREDLSSVFGNLFSSRSKLGPFQPRESSGDVDYNHHGRRLLGFWGALGTPHRGHHGSHQHSRKRRPRRGGMMRRHTRRRRSSLHGDDREPASKVQSRYGKWREKMKNEPELSAQLHQVGAKGLAAFGYEPYAPFLDPAGSMSPVKDFQCDQTVVCTSTQ